jgi:hypothetical protein
MGPTKLLLHLLDFPNQSISFLKMFTVGFFLFIARELIFFFKKKKKSSHTIFSGVIFEYEMQF